eukprot:EG_transcript_671
MTGSKHPRDSPNPSPSKRRREVSGLEYWRQYLAEPRAVAKLPTDLPRPDKLQQSSRFVEAKLPSGCLPDEAHLASLFALHVHRLSAEDDVIVGAALPSVGPAVLPLRLDFSSSSPAAARTFATVAAAAKAHLEVAKDAVLPLNDIEAAAGVSQEAPLFTAVFSSTGSGLDAEGQSPYELLLQVVGETLCLHYQTALFTAEFVADLLQQYLLLLEQTSANPEQGIYSYSVITAQAKQVLPDATAPQDTEFPGPIPHCFHANAEKHPQRIAISYQGLSVTYEELDHQSSQLANRLRQDGIAQHDVIGLYGHRSPAVVLCILAVLKAGAAYSMMDPAYPSDRIMLCMQIAQPKGWLQIAAAGAPPEDLRNFLQGLQLKAWHSIDEPNSAGLAQLLQGVPTTLPAVTIAPLDTAMVAFTSGSTGIPKAVSCKHSPLTAFYPWMSQRFGMGESDRFAMCSGIAHDPLQRDIFTPLFLGATICIPTQDTITTPGQLARWMYDNQITQSCCTPAMGQILITVEDPTFTIPSLKVCLFVGDVLIKRDVLLLHKLAPNVKVVNMFGTTETQRSVGYYEVPRDAAQLAKLKEIIPCGRGMKDVGLILLNKAGLQAGLGEAAEIYVRSPHLSKGYLGLPEDTAAKFIPNPFQPSVAWDRWYRTGDLGHYLPSGDVECVGRADDQIKIRGFRIELGEINAKLSSHPAVKESVTRVALDRAGEKQIVCYVVPTAAAAAQVATLPGELREFLKTKVPSYMVPKAVILLQKMPLTPNGKINHKALPPLDSVDADLPENTASLDHLTPTQLKVLEVIRAALHTNAVGPEDNFFNVGGHSLAAIRTTMELNKSFGIQLPTSVIFNEQTAVRIGSAVDAVRSGSAGKAAAPKVDMLAEAVPAADIQARDGAIPPSGKPVGAFVTGADGFVGSFVVHTLVELTDCPIYCLVLSESVDEAKARMTRALEAIGRWTDACEGRLRILPGNLAKPKLGLTPEAYEDVANNTDVLFHVGAWVNWLHDYYTLKPINVGGTAEVLRLAVAGSRLKSCHHISTTNVYETPSLLAKPSVPELLDLTVTEGIDGGYSQSKWVADAMMGNARRRGIPVSVYRPGFITGDSQTGKWTTDDFLCRFLKGCTQLGLHPDLPGHLGIDMSPVDYVAGAVVRLAINPDTHGKTYHVVSPQLFPYPRYFESLRRNGYAVTPVPYAEWRQRLIAAIAGQGDSAEPNALTAILPTFTENWLDTRIRPKWERTNLDAGLASVPGGFAFPDIDATMDVYLQYLVDLGFMPPNDRLKPSGKTHLLITRIAPRPDQR